MVRKSMRKSQKPTRYFDENYFNLMTADIKSSDEYFALIDENFSDNENNNPKEKDLDYIENDEDNVIYNEEEYKYEYEYEDEDEFDDMDYDMYCDEKEIEVKKEEIEQ